MKRGRHIALLRGINVGGNNRLPMKQLASLFEAAGCRNVVTYIQSGNVVFDLPTSKLKGLAQQMTDAIESEFGFRIPLVVRTGAQLAAIVKSNPFLADGIDEKELHVCFLKDKPTKAQLANLDPDRSPPDELLAIGSELYVRCPNGIARTKYSNVYFDKALNTVSTGRNWRTTRKLLDLVG